MGLAVASLIIAILLVTWVCISYIGSEITPQEANVRYERAHPELAIWNEIQLPIKAACAIVMLIASIGLFSLYRWSPMVLLLAIGANLVVMMMGSYFAISVVRDLGQGHQGSAAEPLSGYQASFAVGALAGSVLSFLHLAWAAFVFKSARVSRAFNRQPEPIPAGYVN
jgi:hypothetical protein